MILDFRCEAPGRIRNKASRTTPAASIRLLENSFTAPSLQFRGASSHDLERSPPACLVEEMQNHFTEEQQAVAPGGPQILIFRSLERPVDEHRPPDNVFLRNESPVAAIQ